MQVYNSFVMEFREFFAKRLKVARAERGYTQEQLAELSGVHLKAIAKYETQSIIPSVETLKKLAVALDVSTDYFVFDQAKMEGIPKIKDPELFEQYFILETLNEDERQGALTLLKALIASHELKEITAKLSKDGSVTSTASVASPKKADPNSATA